MKTIEIYEPAMCCPTGLCGVSVDPELLRISTVIEALKKKGIKAERYNLSSAPMAFVHKKAIHDFMNKKGAEGLPVTTIDGAIVMEGRYPTNEEFFSLLELQEDVLGEKITEQKHSGGCCEGGSCC